MDIKDVYIPDQNYQGTEEELQHGRQWSEEAKERVRQARKAGRPVREMFAQYYKTAGKTANRLGRSASRGINQGVRVVRKSVDRAIYTKSERRANEANVAASRASYKSAKQRLKKSRTVGTAVVQASKAARGFKVGTKGNLKQRINDTIKSAKKQNKEFKRQNKLGVNMANAKANEASKKYNSAKAKAEAERKNSINGKFEDFSKSAKKVTNKFSKTANKQLKKAGRDAERLANKGLKTLDRMVENKDEEKARLKATRAAERAARSADSTIGRMMGRDAVKEYDKTYKRERDKLDKSPTVKSLSKKATKKINKGISSVEKSINKGLRKADDLIETKEERTARKIAKESRKRTSKTKSKVKSYLSKDSFNKGVSDVVGAYSKLTGDKELERASKKASASYSKKVKAKAKAEYKKDQDKRAKRYDDLIYDKQISIPRLGGKKKKKVKHSDIARVYIPGRTGSSDIILHSDFFN